MKYRYSLLIISILILSACSKKLDDIDEPVLAVSTESQTFTAGQPVSFTLSGDAELITFYSGTPSNDYEFADGRVINVADSGATLAFSSSVQEGAQANQLALLASTDFTGNYSSLATVKAATWTDITDRFLLGTNATFRATGAIDISDLFEPGKPLYLAYKYVTQPQQANGLARNWWIQNFSVLSKGNMFAGRTMPLADQASAGFRIVDDNAENAPARSTITTTRLSLYGNVYKNPDDPLFDPSNPIYDPNNPIYDPMSPSYIPGSVRPTFVAYDPNSPFNDPATEHWAVSAPILKNDIDLGPDRGIAIKGLADALVPTYKYTYTVPGTYNAYFVASNVTIDGEKKIVRQVTITIQP